MEILVFVKRVPMVGGRILLTDDATAIDTRQVGFTISPHEECAVEEAVRLTEAHGGTVTVLSLGPPEAAEQLRDCVAVGAGRAVLLETDGREWGPVATAEVLAEAAAQRGPFDLHLFGNEAADSCGFQVGIRFAHLLGLPVVTGIKHLSIDPDANTASANREYRGVEEHFEVGLPAVVTVKEGINLPRYPSLPGRMRAKKAAVETSAPTGRADGLSMRRLAVPEVERRRAELLGRGVEGVAPLVAIFEKIGVLS